MLTQIIAGDSLNLLGKLVHEVRDLWNIEQHCGCVLSKEVSQKTNSSRKELVKSILSNELNGIKKENVKEETVESKPLVNGGSSVKDEKNSLSWLADVALSNEDKKQEELTDSDDGSFSTLRELLIRPSHKPNGSRAGSPVSNSSKSNNKKNSGNNRVENLDEVISTVVDVTKSDNNVTGGNGGEIVSELKVELKHFIRRDNYLTKIKGMLPIRIMTLTESKQMYPEVPHNWLCDGKLLRLTDPVNAKNYKIFQVSVL